MKTFNDYCSCVEAPGMIHKLQFEHNNTRMIFYVSSPLRSTTLIKECEEWITFWSVADNLNTQNLHIKALGRAHSEAKRAIYAVEAQYTRAGKIINLDYFMRYLRAFLERNKGLLKEDKQSFEF